MVVSICLICLILTNVLSQGNGPGNCPYDANLCVVKSCCEIMVNSTPTNTCSNFNGVLCGMCGCPPALPPTPYPYQTPCPFEPELGLCVVENCCIIRGSITCKNVNGLRCGSCDCPPPSPAPTPAPTSSAPTPAPTASSDCAAVKLINPSLRLEECGNSSRSIPSFKEAVLASPVVDIVIKTSQSARNFLFQLPFNERAKLEASQRFQVPVNAVRVKCDWFDPSLNRWTDTEDCSASEGFGAVLCDCKHLTVFAVLVRPKLAAVTATDTFLAVVQALLLLFVVFQLLRLAYVRMQIGGRKKRSQKIRDLYQRNTKFLFHHAVVAVSGILRLAYLLGKPRMTAPWLMLCALAPTLCKLALLSWLVASWSSIAIFQLVRDPFDRLRKPFWGAVCMFAGLLPVFVVIVAAHSNTSPTQLQVASIGSALFTIIEGIVGLCVLASGILLGTELNHTIKKVKKQTGETSTKRARHVMVHALGLGSCVLLQSGLWIGAMQDGALASFEDSSVLAGLFCFLEMATFAFFLSTYFQSISTDYKKAQTKKTEARTSETNRGQNKKIRSSSSKKAMALSDESRSTRLSPKPSMEVLNEENEHGSIDIVSQDPGVELEGSSVSVALGSQILSP